MLSILHSCNKLDLDEDSRRCYVLHAHEILHHLLIVPYHIKFLMFRQIFLKIWEELHKKDRVHHLIQLGNLLA